MDFDIAGGSAMGSRHRVAGRNNQDAYAWCTSDHALVAVVCDGCGSGEHSEVGAQLGARIFCKEALALCGAGVPAWGVLEAAGNAVLERLRALDVDATEHFLFTIVGVLVDGARATTFSLGDGVIVARDSRLVLGPFEDNAPPYLGHAASGGAPRFELHHAGSVEDVLPIVIGTDGVDAIDLDALAADPRTFANRDHVRRRLTVSSRKKAMSDDATVVLVKVRAGGVAS